MHENHSTHVFILSVHSSFTIDSVCMHDFFLLHDNYGEKLIQKHSANA